MARTGKPAGRGRKALLYTGFPVLVVMAICCVVAIVSAFPGGW